MSREETKKALAAVLEGLIETGPVKRGVSPEGEERKLSEDSPINVALIAELLARERAYYYERELAIRDRIRSGEGGSARLDAAFLRGASEALALFEGRLALLCAPLERKGTPDPRAPRAPIGEGWPAEEIAREVAPWPEAKPIATLQCPAATALTSDHTVYCVLNEGHGGWHQGESGAWK